MKNFIQQILDKNELIGIFGAGISGKSVAEVLESLNKPYLMYDANPAYGEDFILSESKKKLNL